MHACRNAGKWQVYDKTVVKSGLRVNRPAKARQTRALQGRVDEDPIERRGHVGKIGSSQSAVGFEESRSKRRGH